VQERQTIGSRGEQISDRVFSAHLQSVSRQCWDYAYAFGPRLIVMMVMVMMAIVLDGDGDGDGTKNT